MWRGVPCCMGGIEASCSSCGRGSHPGCICCRGRGEGEGPHRGPPKVHRREREHLVGVLAHSMGKVVDLTESDVQQDRRYFICSPNRSAWKKEVDLRETAGLVAASRLSQQSGRWRWHPGKKSNQESHRDKEALPPAPACFPPKCISSDTNHRDAGISHTDRLVPQQFVGRLRLVGLTHDARSLRAPAAAAILYLLPILIYSMHAMPKLHLFWLKPFISLAACSVLCTTAATVMGPTPPGTGVKAEATWETSSKATSPTI